MLQGRRSLFNIYLQAMYIRKNAGIQDGGASVKHQRTSSSPTLAPSSSTAALCSNMMRESMRCVLLSKVFVTADHMWHRAREEDIKIYKVRTWAVNAIIPLSCGDVYIGQTGRRTDTLKGHYDPLKKFELMHIMQCIANHVVSLPYFRALR